MAVQVRRYSLENPALIPGLLAVGTLLALGASNGGFYPTAWYAGALFLLGLLVMTLLALGVPRTVPRPVLVALGLLAAYTAWTYLSIIWASQPGPAWDGANRTATYVVIYALFALWPLEARGATALLALVGLGIAGIGLVELLKANAAADPGTYFIDVRFAEPTGYMNANAALWTIGLVPCLFIATRRRLPVALRGLALGGAGLLAGVALMSQSRGWVLATPLALAFFVAICPGRVRLLAATAVVALGALLVSGRVLSVHDDYSRAGFDGLVSDATRAILLMALALAVVGAIAALLDRRVEPGPVARRRIGATAAIVVAVALLGGLAAFTIAEGSPTARVADAWDDFKGGGEGPQAGASRFAGGGTNRYDFWTVAWEAFQDNPVHGIGIENFQEEYLLRGASEEEPLYPHSLELGVLSQTGIVGALLLLAGIGAALAAALRARAAAPEARAAAAAALALFVYWILHASVDWFWEFPGLTGPAFAALGIAAALAPRAAAQTRTAPGADAPIGTGAPVPTAGTPGRPALSGRLGIVAAGLLGVALFVSLALPWLAAREVDRAARTWGADAGGALDRLDRAERLNPLSARAPLTAATIALRLNDPAVAAREFRQALEREPRNSYALLELGALAAGEGDRETGLLLVRRAHELSPRNLLVGDAFRRLERGRPLNLQQLNRSILRRAHRLGSQGGQ
jgi:tetratricopeptide (TPR) repeat protein